MQILQAVFLQDLAQNLANLARKILARFANIFLARLFYWEVAVHHLIVLNIKSKQINCTYSMYWMYSVQVMDDL